MLKDMFKKSSVLQRKTNKEAGRTRRGIWWD